MIWLLPSTSAHKKHPNNLIQALIVSKRSQVGLFSEANLPHLPIMLGNIVYDNMNNFGGNADFLKVAVIPATRIFFWSIVRPSHILTITTGIAAPFLDSYDMRQTDGAPPRRNLSFIAWISSIFANSLGSSGSQDFRTLCSNVIL